jgi:hypothetical protein
MAERQRFIMRGRVVRLDPAAGDLPWVTVPELGVERQIGPCPTIRGDVLAPGDMVLCVSVGGTPDDLAVVGKYGPPLEAVASFSELADVDWDPVPEDESLFMWDGAQGKIVPVSKGSFAPEIHNHDAAQITSGVIAADRLPAPSMNNLIENPGFEDGSTFPHYVPTGVGLTPVGGTSARRSGNMAGQLSLDATGLTDVFIANGQRYTAGGTARRRTVDNIAVGEGYRFVVRLRSGSVGTPALNAAVKVYNKDGAMLESTATGFLATTATYVEHVVDHKVTNPDARYLNAVLAVQGGYTVGHSCRIDDLSLQRITHQDLTPIRLRYASGAYPPRPAWAKYVEWVGPVVPTFGATGAANDDTWIQTTT